MKGSKVEDGVRMVGSRGQKARGVPVEEREGKWKESPQCTNMCTQAHTHTHTQTCQQLSSTNFKSHTSRGLWLFRSHQD